MNIQMISYLNSFGKCSLKEIFFSPNELIKIYKTMVLTRYIDERMILLQRQGFIPFAMSSRGEEACSVASAAALNNEDWMYPQYRESGIMFWRGYPIQKYVDHMFGNQNDPNHGRQLSNHFGCKELNVVTVSCPVGTQIIQASGCAYAMKVQKEKNVVISYFGEGTTSQGDFHTGLNFAAVQRAPVIFFCRNNGYAISTPCSSQFASDGIAPKGVGYGIEAFRIDGNDIFAVYETVKKAKNLCLEGKGPILIEAMTYRLGPHSTSDDCSYYRPAEEKESMEIHCPILRLKAYLNENKLWNQETESAFLKSLKEEVDEAIENSKKASLPSIKKMFEDVYHKMPDIFFEQSSFQNQVE